MNKHERRHIETLERRRQYLRSLREDKMANNYDEQEISALNWVLKEVVPQHERESA